MERGTVLLTGGAGYIGSHTAVELLAAGWPVVVLDDLSNGHPDAVARAAELGGGSIELVVGSIDDRVLVERVLTEHEVTAVVHLAGKKAVGESVAVPLDYYRTNVGGTFTLLSALQDHDIRRVVFSSSATVYGEPEEVPLHEGSRLAPTNPYGRTKLHLEDLLRDVAASEPGWHVLLLRYFNPVGAHPSGRIGEDPAGIPNNLMPFVMQVAVGRLAKLAIFGDDYPTPDGTCIRDYLHVVDLAKGHVAALEHLDEVDGCRAVNLGTGRGSSVREVVAAAGRAVGAPIAQEVGPRRAGDAATCWADASLAAELLGWHAELDLDAMCADAWRWQSANPTGYRTA